MKQALELALEALERSVATCFDQYSHNEVMSRPEHFVNHAITALRQVIEQAQKQEPVAWWIPKAEQFCLQDKSGERPFAKAWEPLYAMPPQRQPLTSKQIREIEVDVALNQSFDYPTTAEQFVRAIEAAHGIKE